MQRQNFYILAININVINVNKVCKNLSLIICFNYNKIGYYANKYIELKTNAINNN